MRTKTIADWLSLADRADYEQRLRSLIGYDTPMVEMAINVLQTMRSNRAKWPN